ncbi:MAG TPA: hypothetical protein VN249_08035 [Prolixibacteraceae bacterium]|nr:hypothetical protein [Prolixibacteraceae bacterium]
MNRLFQGIRASYLQGASMMALAMIPAIRICVLISFRKILAMMKAMEIQETATEI